MYDFKKVRGHVAVYLDGVFQFSADSISEAHDEIQKQSNSDYCDRHAET